jgi:CHAT domain-containing protein
MSRWPLSDSGKPSLPPAGEVDVDQFAVVTGNYAGSSLNPLVHAIQEAETLSALYKAIPLMARSADIKQLLGAQIPNGGATTGVQAVHFACHGEAIQDQAINAAILLEKDQRMSPLWLSNSQLGKQDRPFMFLNACQVGRTGELLGGLSGFAGQSLLGGFRGFIAPLWAVNDVIAHDVAVAFYERAFGNTLHGPQPVASILRELRQPFANDKTSATRLAYVFFGHPALILRRL